MNDDEYNRFVEYDREHGLIATMSQSADTYAKALGVYRSAEAAYKEHPTPETAARLRSAGDAAGHASHIHTIYAGRSAQQWRASPEYARWRRGH
jgi:hypothetical protein